jgi:hypothetical protein
MDDTSTTSPREWLRVIRRDARSTEILLDKYGTTIEKTRWIHGAGRLAVPRAGVYLYLWKPAVGKSADLEVVGIEFSFSKMRGGTCYSGHVPFRIKAGDSPDQVRQKLRPRNLHLDMKSRTATATDRTHRFIARFDSRNSLAGLTIMSQFVMRRQSRS